MKFIYESENKKEQMVLVTTYDRNRKQHFYICRTMEDAKRLFPSDYEKRWVTIKE